MPVVIEDGVRKSRVGKVSSCSLDQCIDALADLRCDPYDPDNVIEAARWLGRLNANRTFLADQLIGTLCGRGARQIATGYGPQAIVLSPVRGGMFLRANIWPAEHDLCFKNSGAHSFVYGIAHDHNFSFLTSGYLGPGYQSDCFEYDYSSVAGLQGEAVTLHPTGRSALSEGRIMLYRAHRDVHSQMPPESLSVSLNVMHVDPAQSWFDQYEFDLEQGRIGRVLSSNASEVFMRIAVASGSDEALEYAEWVGGTHPSERLRLASFEARAGVYRNPQSRDALWREAETCGSQMVAVVAKQRRAAL